MKISKNGQYALISVADLAMHDDHQSIAKIAGRHNIDPRYLGQIFFTLKKAGIISSVRGKNGGYFLCKNPLEITAGDVVRAIEGDLAPTKCSIDRQAAVSCDVFHSCITYPLWQTLAFQINHTLNRITIAEIADQFSKWRTAK